jgi:hypothetical protein
MRLAETCSKPPLDQPRPFCCPQDGSSPAGAPDRACDSPSGERLPVVGSARPAMGAGYDAAEMAPLRDVLRQFAERGGRGDRHRAILWERRSAWSVGGAVVVGREAGSGDRDSFRRLRTRASTSSPSTICAISRPSSEPARAQAGGPHPLRGHDDCFRGSILSSSGRCGRRRWTSFKGLCARQRAAASTILPLRPIGAWR